MEQLKDSHANLFSVTPPVDRHRAPEWFSDGELQIIRDKRPNVLLIGPTRVVDSAVNCLVMGAGAPVWFWTPAQPIQRAERAIVVIRDAGILAPREQAAWLEALDRPLCERPLQVIATNSFAIFPLVQRGLFLDGLYYRLNSMLVSLRRAATAP
jgi:hypothetical protein